ncbi:MAG: hypothetical protein JO363_10720 [Solirubrobacterales bacterium]|nr:hypothetical protein [Solirubrobacterales bacterium]
MINLKYYLGLLGFLFVAAWITLDFGDAILCLVGAIVFYAVGSVLEGEIDLGDMQARMQRSRSAPR